MANTLNVGNGDWATKENSLLGYNSENGNYKPLAFDFTRASNGTFVNKSGLIETAASGVPRIDFSNDAKGALLLEPQSTNLVTYSSDFSQWSALNNVVVTDNFITSPDGTQNAAKLVFDGTASGRIELNTGASGTNTQSVYLKTESGTQNVSIGAGSADLTQFTITDQWVRYAHTGGGNFPRILCNDAATIYVYGAQLEAGSYSTSLIKTSGSAVTRNGDQVYGAGDAATFNDSEGVLYAEFSALSNDGTFRILSLSNGTTSNEVKIQLSSTDNTIGFGVVAGGVPQTDQFYTIADTLSNNKIAAKYKENDFALWVNGIEVLTDSSGIIPTGLSTLNFERGTGSNPFYGNTKQIQYFNTALTDSELEKLTSWASFIEMAQAQNYNII